MSDMTDKPGRDLSRRDFIAYLVAAPTLVAAAELSSGATPAQAAGLPTVQPVDAYDLSDLLTDAALPTSNLITVTVNSDGTASFALPRAEVGQGITTAVAQIIADQLSLTVDKVNVTLADARPELIWNQITGGSNTLHAIYKPVQGAAAAARAQLTKTAADQLGVSPSQVTLSNGQANAGNGKSIDLGALAKPAAVSQTTKVPVTANAAANANVGQPTKRIDALDIVTGKKQFAMDLTDVPDALPTMVCRPPTINATAKALKNQAQVQAMPGVSDIALIPHTKFVAGGVAVRAQTFGQCIDAIRAMDVDWGPGSVDGKSADDVKKDLIAAELPGVPTVSGITLDQRFTFHFRPGDPLETNAAVANVTADSAEVWSSLKTPVWVQEQLCTILGMSKEQVKVHVAQGGGSFGRHLFGDAAFEAASISKAMGKPVKLMWHRTDNFRQGRVHPMCTSRVRVNHLGNSVLSFEQRHTSVATDFSHGFGELLTANLATLPAANSLGYSQAIFNLSVNSPYNFGVTTQLLNEIYAYDTFNTSSVRNIYGPETRTAGELMVDQTAKAMGQDPYQFRRTYARDKRMVAVLDAVAKAGNWGRQMAPNTAQGIGVHHEYKSFGACLVEIDCTPATVNRKIQDGYSGPRVTKVVFAVDVGLPINPLGLQAQMMGGCMDGIAQALSYSLHLQDGYFLEGSWDNVGYTREWNTPPDVQVIVMDPTSDSPGGAGELGVPASMAATACAYARATGTLPTEFPINHNDPLWFDPVPTTPPIPASPVTAS
ncbi:MAG: xanthine dehydrogenase family protein molybdopterin-binding subunit [Solirubrobacterales bacterium]|nr:xanthine dehydrogenase family protein molybdopterin-binding subunit [Solirubrobacterales bacterium]